MKLLSIFLYFLILSFFMFGCHHKKRHSCPQGQIDAEGTKQCVPNSCINVDCGLSKKCVVTLNGYECRCNSKEQRIDENGNCYYDETVDVTCSNHGHLSFAAGENYCECDEGYENLDSNKFTCIPKTFSQFCNNGTCEDGTVIPYFENHPDNGLNFYIMGDGYTSRDLSFNGIFSQDAKKFINYLISREPYKSYAKYINFYIIFVESAQKGVDLKCENDTVNSALDACFRWPGHTTSLNVKNLTALNRYVGKNRKTPHLKIVILNEDRYFAGTAYIDQHIGIFPRAYKDHNDQVILLTMYHEVGHAFGGLGDEYGEEGYAQDVRDQVWNSHPMSRINYYPNLSDTNDLNIIKWKSLIPYYEVGAVEGGYYRNTGVWRPERTCVMKSQFENHNLCSVCLETIVKKMHTLLRKPYSLNDFMFHFPAERHPAPNIRTITTKFNENEKELKRLEQMLHRSKDVFTDEDLKGIVY